MEINEIMQTDDMMPQQLTSNLAGNRLIKGVRFPEGKGTEGFFLGTF